VGVLLLASVAALAGCGKRAPETARKLVSVRVPLGADLRDPDAAIWRRVPDARVVLQAQNVATPTNPKPAVTELRVRTAHDGEIVAFRMVWSDGTESAVTTVDRFGDQVAVQFPLDPGAKGQPSPMMGHGGTPVRILQWRSVLQHELTHGRPTTKDLYPNAVSDLYPDRLLSGEVAAPYTGGRAVGNPVSEPRLLSPVVTHVAEGFGSLTAAPDQPANGSGVWRSNRWSVTITHPFARAAESPHGLKPGLQTFIGFAVWEGGHREVGSRKAWTAWIPFEIAP
jgi:hypothetical protein